MISENYLKIIFRIANGIKSTANIAIIKRIEKTQMNMKKTAVKEKLNVKDANCKFQRQKLTSM